MQNAEHLLQDETFSNTQERRARQVGCLILIIVVAVIILVLIVLKIAI